MSIMNSKVHIVESYDNNGLSWYRKYSDGWIEQGIAEDNRSLTPVQTWTLPHPMATSNYTVVQSATPSGNYTGSYASGVKIRSRTTTTIGLIGLGSKTIIDNDHYIIVFGMGA